MGRRASSTYLDVPETDSVASGARDLRRLPGAGLNAHLGLGFGRLALGAAFVSAPGAAVRMLGVDAAAATRMTWLARMAAVRDAALGAGLLGSVLARGGAPRPWLLAGAFTDAGDAAVLVLAAREGRVDRTRGYLMAAGAAASALVGVGEAVRRPRRPD